MSGSTDNAVVQDSARWVDVCEVDAVVPGTGVAALIAGEQIAIVRTHDDKFYALSNFDPFSRAFVLARGIVGEHAGIAKIASPVYKQCFALETGQCIDDPSIRVAAYALRLREGRVEIYWTAAASAGAAS
jgi:nitrite reductase (NADH) small subunit